MTSLPLMALNLLLFPIELISATALFVVPLQRRSLWWLRLISGIVVMVGACFLLTWLKSLIMSSVDSEVFNFFGFGLSYLLTVLVDIILVAIYEVGVYFIFKTNIFSVIFICCASFLTQNIARCLFFLYFRLRDPKEGSVLFVLQDPINLAVYFAIFIAIYVACYFVFARKHKSGDEDDLFRRFLIPLVFIILINILMSGINMPKDNDAASILYLFLLFSRICLCVTGLTIQFLVVNWYRMKLDQSRLQQIMLQQKEQFEIAKDSIDTVNVNAHDLKRQINVILNAVRGLEKDEKLEDGLNGIIESISMLDTNYRTGNKALDVTLTEKARVCLRKKIRISTIADGCGLSFMADFDIYALFGNILDNAIEATEHLEDEEDRIISFSVRKEGGIIVVHCENTFAAAPKFVDGIPQTIKSDKRTHGFGVKSMINIAKKYGGNLSMKAENGLFYVDAIFPLK